MATTYRVLGQSAPASDTETTVYTVPSSTSTIVSTIAITNQSTSTGEFSVAVRPSADATTSTKHYITYRVEIAPRSNMFITAGITMSAGDKILIFCTNPVTSVSVFGSEIA